MFQAEDSDRNCLLRNQSLPFLISDTHANATHNMAVVVDEADHTMMGKWMRSGNVKYDSDDFIFRPVTFSAVRGAVPEHQLRRLYPLSVRRKHHCPEMEKQRKKTISQSFHNTHQRSRKSPKTKKRRLSKCSKAKSIAEVAKCKRQKARRKCRLGLKKQKPHLKYKDIKSECRKILKARQKKIRRRLRRRCWKDLFRNKARKLRRLFKYMLGQKYSYSAARHQAKIWCKNN